MPSRRSRWTALVGPGSCRTLVAEAASLAEGVLNVSEEVGFRGGYRGDSGGVLGTVNVQRPFIVMSIHREGIDVTASMLWRLALRPFHLSKSDVMRVVDRHRSSPMLAGLEFHTGTRGTFIFWTDQSEEVLVALNRMGYPVEGSRS